MVQNSLSRQYTPKLVVYLHWIESVKQDGVFTNQIIVKRVTVYFWCQIAWSYDKFNMILLSYYIHELGKYVENKLLDDHNNEYNQFEGLKWWLDVHKFLDRNEVLEQILALRSMLNFINIFYYAFNFKELSRFILLFLLF